MLILIVLLSFTAVSNGLENGLARTPPMGWLSWERFRCNIDCESSPQDCISETLIKRTADAMVSGGYLDVGYEYVIIDDCWLSSERDSDGRLQADADRFPSGIKGLADYVHSKGLKLGIYEDIGTKTCAGYPGLEGNLEIDAQTMADWEIDYIKVDGCNIDPAVISEPYIEFGKYLNATGRPIVYATEWPVSQASNDIEVDYASVAETCNVFRAWCDIQDSWGSLLGIMNYMGVTQDKLQPAGGPGHWSDPDMLLIGNFGLNEEQNKIQMAIWSILAAPLLMSTDLDTISDASRDILLNKNFVAVNQDPLGIPGLRILKDDTMQIWRRPISPTSGDEYSYAISILYLSDEMESTDYTTTLKDIGLTSEAGYTVEDWLTREAIGEYMPDDEIVVTIASMSGAYIKAVVKS